MGNKNLARYKGTEPTQKYLNIEEIKGDTVVLRDGSIRAIIAVSSTNFALKSEEEQNAITAAYQGFLNSLDFPIQILISSRILDINGYLEKLRGLMTNQSNELLRIQMSEYIEYISKLVEFANIMSKNFYVIVSYSSNPVKETIVSKFTRFFNPTAGIVTRQADFDRAKSKLDERVAHVISELASMGLRSVTLNTEQLVELLYESYNFESASPLREGSLEEIDLENNKNVQ